MTPEERDVIVTDNGRIPSEEALRIEADVKPVAAGDEVFRVVEYDPPDGLHTWVLAARRVRSIRKDGKVVLDSPFPGLATKIMGVHCIDSLFHRSCASAVAAFKAQLDSRLASAQRAMDDAKRGLAWAASAGAEP